MHLQGLEGKHIRVIDVRNVARATSTLQGPTQTIGKTMYTGTLRSPAVAYGRLYVGDDEWRIHCLNASTGSPIWNYTTGSYVSACPAIAYGRVFVGSCDGTVYCLDAYTGRSIWNYTTEQPVQSSATVSDGRVYFGSWDHNVYCLSASTGAKIWNYTADIAVFSS